MNAKQALKAIEKRFAKPYDFAGTVLDDAWAEDITTNATQFITEGEWKAIEQNSEAIQKAVDAVLRSFLSSLAHQYRLPEQPKQPKCAKHPRYTGKRAPRTPCDPCWCKYIANQVTYYGIGNLVRKICEMQAENIEPKPKQGRAIAYERNPVSACTVAYKTLVGMAKGGRRVSRDVFSRKLQVTHNFALDGGTISGILAKLEGHQLIRLVADKRGFYNKIEVL